MRLTVRHSTTYTFSEPAVLTVQSLRLTPQPFEALRVLSWRVLTDRPGALPGYVDGYGNGTLLLTRRGPHDRVAIIVEGEVETRDAGGAVRGTPEPLPPTYFLRETALTTPDDALRALAARFAGDAPVLDRLTGLTAAILATCTYVTGVTDTGTTAAAALANGAGVCQDHAHIMATCARLLGLPARYVSGYLWPGEDRDDLAAHAWTEVHLGDAGWQAFDAANDVRPGERYLRLAVGLDYAQAAPVRGLRRGRGGEELEVHVRVDAVLGTQ